MQLIAQALFKRILLNSCCRLYNLSVTFENKPKGFIEHLPAIKEIGATQGCWPSTKEIGRVFVV